MEIKIYGMAGKEIIDLEMNVLKALEKIDNEDVKFIKISDPVKINAKGILSLPALEVNGKLKFEGKIPPVHELIKEYLK